MHPRRMMYKPMWRSELKKNNKKFTAAQQDTINFYYSRGMNGIRKECSAFISRAALESSLIITQVKVIEQGG